MPLPLNTMAAIVTGLCISCRCPTSQCAECAVVVLVDPADGLPLDVAKVDGRYVSKPVDPQARERAVQVLVCDGCVVEVRTIKPGHIGETATERHERGMCANASGR